MKHYFNKQDKLVLTGIVCYFIALLTIALNTNGTCDSGDSIWHFLFSKYAFQHPENFLNHWAKPLFVFLSAPFAQFGFVGIKTFNCTVAAFSAWFTYQIAIKLNYKNAWIAPLFLAFTPGYLTHIFSGLTEPLFALTIIISIYFILVNRIVLAICIISFLPFIRSEGLIIIGIFAAYLLSNKLYRYLPYLLLGHIAYSLIGAYYYKDLLWVFIKIPYSHSSGKYGSGNLSHFFIQLNYIIGIPLYFLLSIGFIKRGSQFFSDKKINFNAETILIYGSFLTFIVAHSFFWYFGIFESMGLNRVLISIVPLAALISLNGLNYLSEITKQNLITHGIIFVFTGLVILFPFVPNPASVNWDKEFSLSKDELLITDACIYIETHFPKNRIMYYSHPYINLSMNKDPFDTIQNRELKKLPKEKRPDHYLIIWDNSFSLNEEGVSLEQLKADKAIKLIKTYKSKGDGKNIQVVIFVSLP